MMKAKRLLGFGLVLFTIGCAPPSGPDRPSFATDIKPIMLAHCVRCHGAGGTLNADPDTLGDYRNTPPSSLYLDTYEDPMPCPGTSCKGAKNGAPTFAIFIPGSGDTRMPPPPSDPLPDHQMEIVLRWAKITPPAP